MTNLNANFKNCKTRERTEMNNSFTLTKIDDVKITLKNYKDKIKKMTDIILSLDELKSSKIYKNDINRVRFDISFCKD